MSSNNTTIEERLCRQQFTDLSSGVLFSHLIVAAIIVIILGFVQRRKKLAHGFLWGFPGIIVPMDFLVFPRYRFIYIITFGVMATSFVSILQNIYTPPEFDFYGSIFWRTLGAPFVLVLVLALQYAPLFACVNAPIPLLGHSLGFIYSFLWLLQLVVSQIASGIPVNELCSPRPLPILFVLTFVASVTPIFGTGVIIVVWYGFKTVQGLLRLCGLLKLENNTQQFICCGNNAELRSTDPPKRLVKAYHVQHVQKLLTPKKIYDPAEDEGRARKLFIKIVSYVFPYNNDFRLPLPFVGAVFAMSMLLYQLTVVVIIFGVGLTSTLSPFFSTYFTPILNGLEEIIARDMPNNTIVLRALEGADETFGLILVGVPVFVCVSPFVSMLFSLALLINMVATVSKHLKTIAREGFPKEKLPSPTARVTASWKYVGHLLGFFFLAWVIYTLIVFVVLVVLSILYLGLKYLTQYAVAVLVYILVPLIWSQLVFVAQTIVCRLVFLKKTEGNFIAITNRRMFNWFAYILFFYNGIAGFVSAILRTIMSSIFSLILLFRLDQVILLRGFEQFDFGHKAYLGFIYLYFNYNNPVMHVFIQHLTSSVVPRSKAPDDMEALPYLNAYSMMNDDGTISSAQKAPTSSRLIRNRWLKAYLLIRNPSLVKFTASNINANKNKKSTVEASFQ